MNKKREIHNFFLHYLRLSYLNNNITIDRNLLIDFLNDVIKNDELSKNINNLIDEFIYQNYLIVVDYNTLLINYLLINDNVKNINIEDINTVSYFIRAFDDYKIDKKYNANNRKNAFVLNISER